MNNKTVLLFIFSLFASVFLQAMELDPSEITQASPEKKIEIRSGDITLYIPEQLATEIAFFKNYLAYAQLCSDDQGEKENDKPSIDFSALKLYQAAHEDDQDKAKNIVERLVALHKTIATAFRLDNTREDHVTLEKLDISPATLEKFFACVGDQRMVKSLEIESINPIFAVADSFGAPDELLRKMTLRGKKLLEPTEQHKKIVQGHYLNSIRSLYNAGFLKNCLRVVLDTDGHPCGALNFARKELDSLQGLEDYLEKYKNIKIKKLDVQGNALTTLDLCQVLKCMPNVIEIVAKDNRITTLIVSNLPDGISLDLENNNLQQLPPFKAGQEAKINLKRNPLNRLSRFRLRAAIQPTFFEKHHHQIKTLTGAPLVQRSIYSYAMGAGGVMLAFALLYPAFYFVLIPSVQDVSPAGRLKLEKLLGSFILEAADDPNFYMYFYWLAHNPVASAVSWILPFCFGAVGAGEYYLNHGHANQFKPATIIFDQEDEEDT